MKHFTKEDAPEKTDLVAEALGYKEHFRNSVDLTEAAFDGDLEDVILCLEKGFHIESKDAHLHSALSEAACQGNDEIVELLIEKGADPNTTNDQLRSALYRAAYNGHLSTAEILLQHGSDPRIRTKQR